MSTTAVKFSAAALLLAGAGSTLAEVHYVDVNSTNAAPPYANWTTAATNIQDAVDVAVAGDEVVVTNGTYPTGGRTIDGVTTNRVAADKPVSLRSVNGPTVTTIDGSGQVRCVYLTNEASLCGFTLTHGFALYGGGLNCVSAAISNCVIVGNRAITYGAGVSGGTLENCTLQGNSVVAGSFGTGSAQAGGGGAAFCTLNRCALIGNSAFALRYNDGYPETLAEGGGAWFCTLNNCTVVSNSASATVFSTLQGYYSAVTARGGGASECTLNNCWLNANWARVTNSSSYPVAYAQGGGAYSSTLNNSTLSGNWAGDRNFYHLGRLYAQGGGAHSGTLNNCTLVGNSAISSSIFTPGGGAYSGTLNNCILYFNQSGYPGSEDEYYYSTLNYCWGSDPLFVDTNGWANLRLQSNSPCINAGNNAFAPPGPDLDGNPRIAGGTVDIGAYEFQSPVSQISYAWLQQFGLPINAATDWADPDGDGVDNYHEWLAGTDPTNRFSSPAQLTIIPSGTNVILTWSTNAVGFTLQSTTNLASPAVWNTNSPAPVVVNGQNTVTNLITGPQQFYRLSQ
jgi:hypothetical protein